MGDNEPELNIRSLFKCTPFKADEKISCMTGTTTNIFIGTTLGNVYNVRKLGDSFEFQTGVHFGSEKIHQLEHLSALEIILVICGTTLIELSLDPSAYLQVISTQKNVSSISLNQHSQVNDADDPFCVHLAIISSSKTISLCRKTTGRLNNRIYQKISCNDVVRHAVFNGKSVCYATSNAYFIHNLVENRTLPLFPIDEPRNAKILAIDMNEFLLFTTGLAMIISADGVSTRPPLIFHESQILSSVYKSPNIMLLGNEHLSIYGKDDSQMDHSIVNTNGWSEIFEIEGQMFLCNSNEVFQMAQATFQNRVSRLIAKGQLDKALDECEKEYQLSPKDEVIELVKDLKKQIGFKMLDERNWNDAYEYLISSATNPMEVVGKFDIFEFEQYFGDIAQHRRLNEKVKEKVAFLKLYLSDVQRQDFMNLEMRKEVDASRIRFGIFIDSSKWTAENHRTMAEICEEREEFVKAGEHWIAGGEVKKGLEIWGQRVGDFNDVMIETLQFLSEKAEILQVVQWLLSKYPDNNEKIMKAIDNENFTLIERADILKPLPESYREFLFQNSSVLELRSRLLTMQLDEVHTLDSRQKLRKNLLHFMKKEYKIDAELREKLKKPEFEIERRLVEFKPTLAKTEETVTKLMKEKDLESVEGYIDLHLKDHPSIIQTLYSVSKSVEPSQELWSLLINYLYRINDPEMTRKLVEELPLEMRMREISSSLKDVVAHKLEDSMESRMILAAQKWLLSGKRDVKPTGKVIITENARCEVCSNELTLTRGSITYLPSGYVVHTSCIRHPGLCPITNMLFNQ